MEIHRSWVVVGLHNGASSNNVTVLDASGRYLVDALLESPSRVELGPDEAVLVLGKAFDSALDVTASSEARYGR